jgi:lipopolysaccharide transport system ATP-binding protein
MSSENAIKVDNLTKCYQVYERPSDRLKQLIVPRIGHLFGSKPPQYYQEFWALNGVSFEVERGTTVGIVGRNGSGKSTLLQLICGTLNPTSGTIVANGRIAALLELGSGFNPEFTGRENVYMNAAVLGLKTEEIDRRFDDIASFADIGKFIDQPVKTYSSGMMVRLAFAVQAQVSPDILIVDEALAVGDAKFQAKCFDRLKKLKDGGTSILLVTHSSEQIVTHCSSALLLEKGSALEMGHPRKIVNRYMDLLFGKERTIVASEKQSSIESDISSVVDANDSNLSYTRDAFSTRTGYNPHEYRWGDGSAEILDFDLVSDEGSYPTAVNTGQAIVLLVAIRFMQDMVRPIFGMTIKTKEGVTVYGVNSETLEADQFQLLGRSSQIANVKIKFKCSLAPGDYFISLGIATKNGEEIIPHDRRYDSIHLQVRPVTTFFGLVDLSVELSAKEVSK